MTSPSNQVDCLDVITELHLSHPPSSDRIRSSEENSDIFCWMKTSKKTKSLCKPEATKLQEDRFGLPSHDALARILQNDRRLYKGATDELHQAAQHQLRRAAERPEASQAKKSNINHTYQVHHPHKRPPLHRFGDELHMAEITDWQTQEVENYRSAMGRMADDIIELRSQVVTLEAENSQLRIDLSLHQDLGQDLQGHTSIDAMTKAEIADCIASLKFKLASESRNTRSQRNRIQQLQNELIKKNDSEKKLLQLQRVQQQQQKEEQRHQARLAKMETLETTVKQQEKVIDRMEKMLESREKNQQSGNRRFMGEKQTNHNREERELSLAAGNTGFREEQDRIHQRPPPTKDTLPLREKLSLQKKLSEARDPTLEAQLQENSQSGKQEMLTELS
ncbi:uncharacterized protein V6R79_022458 [Siganus canaliculatus]